jgi:hypothetical protein
MRLRRFVQRQLTDLRTEPRILWLRAHSRQSIPTQTGLTTIGEAWKQQHHIEQPLETVRYRYMYLPHMAGV